MERMGKPAVRMISSVGDSAACERERHCQRVVKESKSILVIHYSFLPCCSGHVPKMTRPHYYLIHTRTHGLPV